MTDNDVYKSDIYYRSMHLNKLVDLLSEAVSNLTRLNNELNEWEEDLIDEKYQKYIDETQFELQHILYQIQEQDKYFDKLLAKELEKFHSDEK
jgi:hypothetical protein